MDAHIEPSLIGKIPVPALAQGNTGGGDALPESQASAPELSDASNAHGAKGRPGKSATRECLVTGENLPKSAMIRFAVAPDGELAVDLAEKLPGRGLWIKAERSVLERALSRNLFTKAARAQVRIPANCLELIASLQRKRCLDLLGIAKGAGEAVLGEEQVESALRHGKLALLIVADDAGKSSLTELARNNVFSSSCPAQTYGADTGLLTTVRLFNRAELGHAFGYAQIVYAGIRKGKFAERIVPELARLEKIVEMPHNSTEASSV